MDNYIGKKIDASLIAQVEVDVRDYLKSRMDPVQFAIAHKGTKLAVIDVVDILRAREEGWTVVEMDRQ